MTPWLATLLLGSGLLAYEKPETLLEVAAHVSPRPHSCREVGSFWHDRAQHDLAGCSLLARGYSALPRHPERALEIARQLSKLSHRSAPKHHPKHHEARLEPAALATRASAALLMARAQAALRDFTGARAAFEQAHVRSPEQLSDPAVLHDYALTQVATGQLQAGAEAYRLLLLRVNLLPANDHRRRRAVVESAMAVMRTAPDGAEEAASFLQPHVARREYRGGDHYALAALNLALDRKNAPLLKHDSLIDAVQTIRDRNDSALGTPWLLPHEWAALEAVLYSGARRAEAHDAWRRYLAAAPVDDPWRAHAERRLQKTSSDGATP